MERRTSYNADGILFLTISIKHECGIKALAHMSDFRFCWLMPNPWPTPVRAHARFLKIFIPHPLSQESYCKICSIKNKGVNQSIGRHGVQDTGIPPGSPIRRSPNTRDAFFRKMKMTAHLLSPEAFKIFFSVIGFFPKWKCYIYYGANHFNMEMYVY